MPSRMLISRVCGNPLTLPQHKVSGDANSTAPLVFLAWLVSDRINPSDKRTGKEGKEELPSGDTKTPLPPGSLALKPRQMARGGLHRSVEAAQMNRACSYFGP